MLTQIQTICEQLTEACARMGLDHFLNAKEALKKFLRLVTQGKYVAVEEISMIHRKREGEINVAYFFYLFCLTRLKRPCYSSGS